MNRYKYLKSVFSVLAILVGYIILMKVVGGPNTNPPQLTSELPVITLLSLIFGLPLKSSRFRWWVACIPVLTFYLIMDIYYLLFDRVFRWSELQEVPEMIDVLPVEYLVLLWIPAIVPVALYSYQLSLKRLPLVALPLSAVLIGYNWVQSAPDSFMSTYKAISHRITPQNEARTVRNNGRLLTTMYYEAARQKVLSTLATSDNLTLEELDSFQSKVQALSSANRNIHIIVMESYIHPANFKNISFDKTLDPEGFEWLSEYKAYSISPVFGGHTPQAEFEILCGTPAKAIYSSIEFNLFTGAKTNCLPHWLKANGYKTIASHAHKTTMFNRIKAYQGLGFDEVYFPKEYSDNPNTYLSRNTNLRNGLMFDGDLFDQNLAFIKKKVSEGIPFVNYVLGVYGHTPHLVDESRFPLEVKASIDHDLIQKITNEYVYRTKALDEYLKRIMEVDPSAVIAIVSDHLPPLDGLRGLYQSQEFQSGMEKPIHQNLVYLIDAGNPVRFSGTHHYEIPSKVLDLATDGKLCQNTLCISALDEDQQLQSYNEVMRQAVKIRRTDKSRIAVAQK